jgi:hypothetical protein
LAGFRSIPAKFRGTLRAFASSLAGPGRPPKLRPAVQRDRKPPEVPGLPPAPQLYRLDNVEVFAVGEHRDGDGTWTADQLRAMERNFKLHKSLESPQRGRIYSTLVIEPPKKPAADAAVGHFGDGDKWWEDTSAPCSGLVEDLRFDPDGIARADIGSVPAEVAEAIRDGKLFTVSAIIYDEPPPGCPGSGPCLKQVGFLGGELPQVKTIRPLPLPRPHSESVTLKATRPHAPGPGVHVHAESDRGAAGWLLERQYAEADMAKDGENGSASAGEKGGADPGKITDVRGLCLYLLKIAGDYTPAMDDPAVYPDQALIDQVIKVADEDQGGGQDDTPPEGMGDLGTPADTGLVNVHGDGKGGNKPKVTTMSDKNLSDVEKRVARMLEEGRQELAREWERFRKEVSGTNATIRGQRQQAFSETVKGWVREQVERGCLPAKCLTGPGDQDYDPAHPALWEAAVAACPNGPDEVVRSYSDGKGGTVKQTAYDRWRNSVPLAPERTYSETLEQPDPGKTERDQLSQGVHAFGDKYFAGRPGFKPLAGKGTNS